VGMVTRAGVEARNVAVVAGLIARAALRREESRGAHYRFDAPQRDDARFGHSLGERAGGETRRYALRGEDG